MWKIFVTSVWLKTKVLMIFINSIAARSSNDVTASKFGFQQQQQQV